MNKQTFINAGYTVVGTENNQNTLLNFIKENYPNIIRDTEINLEELKAVLGLPIDEKTNGYGLNFVGRHFARAKYAQKTQQELCLNITLSKQVDTTQNLVLKGDNLDSLKILKSHYSGKIKCIYIDPPYNTTSDEFVYPDKFDKEEAEVLGLANLSESDFARMDFSFKTKKSHNGWLAFMYPRLLLARDLLSKDGVIFISIDDNEQANLKLLCDDVFGEENFVANVIWEKKYTVANDAKFFSDNHDHILVYTKNINLFEIGRLDRTEEMDASYKNPDGHAKGLWKATPLHAKSGSDKKSTFEFTFKNGVKWSPPTGTYPRFSIDTLKNLDLNNEIWFGQDGKSTPSKKTFLIELKNAGVVPRTILSYEDAGHNHEAREEVKSLLVDNVFETPKPTKLIRLLFKISNMQNNDIILDFFAGSGTTGHAVMQLNAEDGGKRKFILCQIDEPIKKDKPAYQFCINNHLPPVISSITIERLKRAGEKIKNSLNLDLSDSRDSNDLFNQDNHTNQKNHSLDIGFKVFDSVPAPQLTIDEQGQIVMPSNNIDALSRIYNMIFTVGLDEPTQVPEEVIKDCIYKIDNHYYITNSHNISSDDYVNAIKNGKVFIDGWTASLNATLQNYKEDVKIVF